MDQEVVSAAARATRLRGGSHHALDDLEAQILNKFLLVLLFKPFKRADLHERHEVIAMKIVHSLLRDLARASDKPPKQARSGTKLLGGFDRA